MIFYPENVFNEEEEYAGQGYVDGETRIVAYKRDGYIYVYEGNDRIGKYQEDNFTIMEALHLAAAGYRHAENDNDISDKMREIMGEIDLEYVQIEDDFENEYTL